MDDIVRLQTEEIDAFFPILYIYRLCVISLKYKSTWDVGDHDLRILMVVNLYRDALITGIRPDLQVRWTRVFCGGDKAKCGGGHGIANVAYHQDGILKFFKLKYLRW